MAFWREHADALGDDGQPLPEAGAAGLAELLGQNQRLRAELVAANDQLAALSPIAPKPEPKPEPKQDPNPGIGWLQRLWTERKGAPELSTVVACLATDGVNIYAGCRDHAIRVYDARTHKLLYALGAPAGPLDVAREGHVGLEARGARAFEYADGLRR